MYNVIVNPVSGNGDGRKIGKMIENTLRERGMEYNISETNGKGHAKELAAQVGGGVVIAVGGDGVFHEVLNGLNTQTCELGFIPCGRGNDFAATLGVPKKPIWALEDILNGKKKQVDYIAVGDSLRCLNVAGTGIDVDVLVGVEEKKDSKFTYLKSLIHCITHFTPFELDVTVGEETTHYSCIMAGVCNGKQFGGGLKLSPVSSIDDGILDLIVMEMPKTKRILGAIMNFATGNHMKKPYTHHLRCEKVSVTSQNNYPIELDGEIYKNIPLVCSVVKGGLSTFEPLSHKETAKS